MNGQASVNAGVQRRDLQMRFVSVSFCLLLVTRAFGDDTGTVSGTASYRERMALPPEAVFEATLEDVSKADAPADVIGQVRIETPGNPLIIPGGQLLQVTQRTDGKAASAVTIGVSGSAGKDGHHVR
jgi:hypothetical protein